MFLAGAVDSGTDPLDRGPISDFWYNPVAGPGSAGVRVNDDSAMRLAVLYGCVNVISQDIAKVPLMMFRRNSDGSRTRVTDHPAIRLMRNPSRGLTAKDWRSRLQAHQLLRGNAFCEIISGAGGVVRELRPMNPSLVDVEVRPDRSLRYHERDPQSGQERIYVEGEVLHFRGLSLDGPLGLSPIDQMRQAIGEGVAAQEYAAGFFANDARPGVVLTRKDHFKDESVKKEWLASFKRLFGGSRRFSAMILEYGMELKDLPVPNHADLQFLELRKLKANEICAIYRVPPHKVAILERSTNNNIEHQGIEYVTDCLLTWAIAWEERLALDLLTEDEQDEYYFEFVLDVLMRGDTPSRYAAYSSAIAAGWLVRNEVRQRENLDKLPNLDEPLEPVNMVPAGTQTTDTTGTPPAQDAGAAPEEEDTQEADARARELELQARQRALNRETRALAKAFEAAKGDAAAFGAAVVDFYAYHTSFVQGAFVVERAVAEAYCAAQADQVGAAIAAGQVPQLLASWEADAQGKLFSPLPAAQPKE